MPPRHPDKEIRAAVAYAVKGGWTVTLSSGHAWGILRCPAATRQGGQVWVWSTPRNREAHARSIRTAVDRCGHSKEEEES